MEMFFIIHGMKQLHFLVCKVDLTKDSVSRNNTYYSRTRNAKEHYSMIRLTGGRDEVVMGEGNRVAVVSPVGRRGANVDLKKNVRKHDFFDVLH